MGNDKADSIREVRQLRDQRLFDDDEVEKSSSGWDRTNDLVVNSHPLYR
jgi:hypothetical protein